MEEYYKGNGYEIIAWANDQEIVLFESFGSYQGEWIMISKDAENYYVYKDWFGSCSGCDDYERRFGYSNKITKKEAKEFADIYRPFVVIPIELFEQLAKEKQIRRVFPANINDKYSEIKMEDVIKNIEDIF